jgi:hypothetical protein
MLEDDEIYPLGNLTMDYPALAKVYASKLVPFPEFGFWW